MSAAKATLLVLGATGGCALAALIKSLENGHDCIALVRTESKLTNLLTSRNVPQDIISRHLTIITGDVKDSSSLAKAIFHESLPNGIVDLIISGVGSVPVFTPNPLRPTLQDPTICQDAAAAILKTLHSGLKPGMKKPLIVALSTTGISDYGRNIPVAMIPLYHWMLPVPHADKKVMEQLITADAQSSDPAISGFVNVRPSLLTDGTLRGIKAVKVDTEKDGKVASKSIGYTISREDVGNWVYETIVENKYGAREAYVNQNVSLTY